MFVHGFTEKLSGSLAKGENPHVALPNLGSSNLPLTPPPLISSETPATLLPCLAPVLPLHHPPVPCQASLLWVSAMVPFFFTSPSPPLKHASSSPHTRLKTFLSTPDWSPYVQNSLGTSFGCSLIQHPNLPLQSKLFFLTLQPTQLPFLEKCNFF